MLRDLNLANEVIWEQEFYTRGEQKYIGYFKCIVAVGLLEKIDMS